MDFDRRFFIYGTGALLTASFANRASAFSEKTGRPLLIKPDAPTGELFCDQFGDFYLGRPGELPAAPTWRQFHADPDVTVQFGDEEAFLEAWDLEAWQLDEAVDDWTWEDHYGRSCGPAALAFHKLKKLQALSDRRPGKCRGWPEGLEFIEGFHPGDDTLVARAEDPVTVALLQAHLIDLGENLKVVPFILD